MTSRQVHVDGQKRTLVPDALIGQGGEAEVYDLGDGRVLKWWKPAEHPDFDGLPDAQAQAKRRIEDAPAKLRALPGNLPSAVVTPCGFALDAKQRVVGYLMPKVSGDPLHSYGELKWRREHPIAGEDLVAMLRSLHDAIAGLHRARVVVGDCNDLNVLVEGTRVHLIDVDSYQYGSYTCPMFSERFVDPRLCDSALQPIKPHDEASDWFAFAVMAFRTLHGVGPWGGVHQPAEASKRCPNTAAARASRRISIYSPDIVYPKAARPLSILPDELAHAFQAIFERDQRGVFPRGLLEQLRLRACSQCGIEHARVRCPACQAQAHVPPAVVHGKLRSQQIATSDLALPYEVRRTTAVYLDGGGLWRKGRLGPERIGNVLAQQTRAWVGNKLGIGFYRAGGFAVGFVFKPDRGLLDDRVVLPKIRGQLVAAHATVGDDRAWLWLTTSEQGRLVTTCVVIGADAKVIASSTLDGPWLAGITGACAAGPHLFVPTDDGIARIEVVQQTIVQTRTFAETAPFVGSGDRLALSPGGIDVLRARDAIRLQLS
ncbi:MAG: hypothetical protein H0V17_32615 [Deltaproteobacteria bacterium]|nr:hypothetical protein [Deltaproteobacteria bacterium]